MSGTPNNHPPLPNLVEDDLNKTALTIWRNLGFANDRLGQVPILAAELRKLLAAISPTAHQQVKEGDTTFMNLVSRYGDKPSQEGFDEIYRRYLAACELAAATALSKREEAGK